MSSFMHVVANLDMGDLNSGRRYRRWVAYGRSKTANLLFTHEPARRLAASGADVVAATAPGVRPDSFTGPSVAGWRGAPAPSWRAPWTLDDRAGVRLWEESERLTGVPYDAPKA